MKRNSPHSLELIRDPRVIRRLLAKVEERDGCWVWTGHVDRKGYGQIKFDGRAHWVHRIAFAAFRERIPLGMTIHHTCYTPGCCNPDHLKLATISANTAEGNRRRADENAPG